MRLPLLAVAAALVLAGCAENPAPSTDKTPTPGDTASARARCGSTTGDEESDRPVWVLDTTMGTIRVTLFCDKTPLTAQHFVNLTESGYFDGTKFHRVIKDFMNQGGDPLTKDDSQASRWGTGGPGYNIKDEFYCVDGTVSYSHPASCPLGLKHDKPGMISMANTGRPETGGSQFFLTAVPTPWLDGKHAIFGEAADDASLETILAINHAKTTTGDRPSPPIVVNKATISW